MTYEGSRAWGSGSATECLHFVQDMLETPWMGSSAVDAWWRWPEHRVIFPRLGDLVYFAAALSNGYWGHVGILTAENQMVSVTRLGVRRNEVDSWDLLYAPLVGYQRWTPN